MACIVCCCILLAPISYKLCEVIMTLAERLGL